MNDSIGKLYMLSKTYDLSFRDLDKLCELKTLQYTRRDYKNNKQVNDFNPKEQHSRAVDVICAYVKKKF